MVAESLSRELEAAFHEALARVRAGVAGGLGELQGLRPKAEQLIGLVAWDDSQEASWWATRSGQLTCVGGPGDFSLTLTPQALSLGEMLVVEAPEGEVLVSSGPESWVIRADGSVLAEEALEQAFERCGDRLEQGLQKLGQGWGAQSTAPTPVPESGSWLSELLGDLAQLAPLARVASPASLPETKRCSECSFPLPPEARFCPGCGHRVPDLSGVCPKCQAPALPDARFCAQCGEPLG